MSQITYCIRGRQLGPDELETIRGVSERYWSQGRSAISRALCEHWDWRQANGRLKDRACQPLVRLETFVDQTRFRGTGYRAANWQYVGTTQGTAKRGNRHFRHDQPKAVFLYPLSRDFRERLNA